MKKISTIKNIDTIINNALTEDDIDESTLENEVISSNNNDTIKNNESLKSNSLLDKLFDEKIESDVKVANEENNLKTKVKKETKKEIENDLEQIIQQLSDEFNEDVLITIGNLREKSQMESAIKGKWNSKLTVEKYRGTKLKKKLDALCSGLEQMYTESRNTPSSYLNSRRATENMLGNNTDVKMLRRAIEENKIIVDYLERCWCAIQGFGFTIKNSIESAKLEMGI